MNLPLTASLVSFDPSQAALVASWHVPSPPDPTRILEWQRDPVIEVRSFVLVQGEPLAYGELWMDQGEQEVELARLIVAPERRQQGWGRQLVKALLVEARRTGLPNAFLRVRPDNDPAIRCYLATGFVRVPVEQEQAFNAGQPLAYAWFQQPLGEWS